MAGLAAGDSNGPIRVHIRKAMHPGESLVRSIEDDDALLHRDGELVMSASLGPLHVAQRSPIARDAIDAAMERPMAWEPPYPKCIGCGHEADVPGVRSRPQGHSTHAAHA